MKNCLHESPSSWRATDSRWPAAVPGQAFSSRVCVVPSRLLGSRFPDVESADSPTGRNQGSFWREEARRPTGEVRSRDVGEESPLSCDRGASFDGTACGRGEREGKVVRLPGADGLHTCFDCDIHALFLFLVHRLGSLLRASLASLDNDDDDERAVCRGGTSGAQRTNVGGRVPISLRWWWNS